MIGKEAVKEFLESKDDFFIATHVGPDGDALGSAIALAMGLDALHKKSTVYCKDGVPDIYRFLPGFEKIQDSFDVSAIRGKPLVLLDCGAPERAALRDFAFSLSVVIDHHETDFDFGDIRWVAPDKPATGLMVFELLKAMGIRITPEIATNLYSAIAIDTGTFRFANTNAEVLRVAAELVESGAEPGTIAINLYSTWSRNRFSLLCMYLSTLEVEGAIAVSSITSEMFGSTGTTSYDTENFVNFPLMMNDIKISAFIREVDRETWKVSLRSRGEIDVAEVAERFQGGGHKNAAGCTMKGEFASVREKLLKELRSALLTG